ncbi:hypothetical protein [Sporolituus thermophilus]|uniref:DUF340 domain-containing protein n=1 Tax=Sporolituus thermophilus DSM 23256 TaxID=1123285 RepID=A0A1G7J7V1_9FIRM|nr:hypothetical protein [Sporolituus thermophilus]SDF21067.1 hypothetical protein SAMN05660235_00810 [Sporolituus thermophilus DSM 23256]
MKWLDMILIFALMGVMSVIGNSIGYKTSILDGAIGYAIIMAITLVGILLARVVPLKLPMVFWISIIALLTTAPFSPVAKIVLAYTNKVDFLALCTPILAYAGLSVGKDLPMFKQMSWRIVIVALAVYTGTFVFATLIAQIMLHVEGLI